MKNQTILLILSFFIAGIANTLGQVAIGINQPAATAMLDLTATDKGFLPPRMTTAERNAIASPAEGLTVYNTTEKCLNYHNASKWISFCKEEVSLWPAGYVHCGAPTEIVDVTNPVTGKTWMDRNLGASRAATSETDTQAYGDYYQWGRGSDGHQCSNSLTTPTLSASDTPGHNRFITIGGAISTANPSDWRTPQNNNLWQGVNGTNNPCPTGYRIPTNDEWNAEILSYNITNSSSAFNSPLKITLAGTRSRTNGSSSQFGTRGYYSTSTVNGVDVLSRMFSPTITMSSPGTNGRAHGLSVRCIKN